MDNDWEKFVLKQKEEDLDKIIKEERLKPEATRKYIDESFEAGALKTNGTAVDDIMPPVSRFGGGNRTGKKQGIIEKLQAFFEKYFGLGNAATQLSKQKMTLKTGSAYVLNLNGATQPANWTLSKKGIVEIVYASSDQVIVRAKKPGSIKLTATTGAKKRTCKITVKKEVSYPKTKTILVGDRIKLKSASVGKWKTSNDSIVTISKKTARSNSVKAVNPGRVTVSVRTAGKTYRCKIKVIRLPNDNFQKSNEEVPTNDENKELPKDVNETSDDLFPDNLIGLYGFGSGSGAWGSNLTLNKDGSFVAEFNNTNMSSGDGYSYSRNVGNCSGRFKITKRVSPFCFEMRIVDYKDEIEPGTTWISDECKFTARGVPGLGSGESGVFYLKGSPRDTLPEDRRNGGIGIGFTEDGLLKTNFIYFGGATYTGPF